MSNTKLIIYSLSNNRSLFIAFSKKAQTIKYVGKQCEKRIFFQKLTGKLSLVFSRCERSTALKKALIEKFRDQC